MFDTQRRIEQRICHGVESVIDVISHTRPKDSHRHVRDAVAEASLRATRVNAELRVPSDHDPRVAPACLCAQPIG
jgi:hypothetical protein